MKINLHINFSGQCQEAFEFYQSILGGEIKLLTYGDSPAKKEIATDWHEKIVHGSFELQGLEIAGADVRPEHYQSPQGFHLLLQLESESEAKRIFNAFSEGGAIVMPLQNTFWSSCYGIVRDKFGISWEINYVAG
jgi:PhnB protein